MTTSKSQQLLRAIEDERHTYLIAYVTSDRPPPFQAKMALDVVRHFHEHLEHLARVGSVEKIDLFLFSLGGDTIVPWRLANLIREYTREFAVLVPYKAHSAATLVALGADEIVIGPMGELSPIDPSVSTPFNPPHPDEPKEPKVEIGVEDVSGFINLARERVGITDQDNLVRMLEKLSERIHPLAIGAVYRSHALIRLLASKLLALHMKQPAEAQRIPKIVDDLAEKLYYHNYLISRTEAEELGLKVMQPSAALEKLLWELYLNYETEMDLGRPFDPLVHLGESEGVAEVEKPIALIESRGLRSHIRKRVRIQRVPAPPGQPPGPQIAIQEQVVAWETAEIAEE
jgi:hypothetical protein